MDCVFCRKVIKKDVVKCIPCNKNFHPSCCGLHKVIDGSGHYVLCKGVTIRAPSSPGPTDVFVDASSSVPALAISTTTTPTTTYSVTMSTASASTLLASVQGDQTPVIQSSDLSTLCADVRAVLQCQNDMKSLLQAHTSKLNLCTDFVRSQKAHNTAFGNSLASLTTEINTKFESLTRSYTEVSSRISALETSFANLKSQFDGVQSTVAAAPSVSCQSDMERMAARLCKLEQDQSSCDLLISGFPETRGENLALLVTRLSEVLDVSLSSRDIINVRRLPSRQTRSPTSEQELRGKPRTIFLRLATVLLKNTILSARRQRGRISANEVCSSFPDSLIRINDFIPKDSWLLLKAVRPVARERGYRFAWFSRGKIFVKKEMSGHHLYISPL